MGQYDGGNGSADGSGWQRPVSNQRNGENHPAPAETRVNEYTGKTERTPSPEPDSSVIVRNFGRTSR